MDYNFKHMKVHQEPGFYFLSSEKRFTSVIVSKLCEKRFISVIVSKLSEKRFTSVIVSKLSEVSAVSA